MGAFKHFVTKRQKSDIAVFYRYEHVLILIGGKNYLDIIGFVIDFINRDRGAGKYRAYLRFYHSHCSWFGRFELDSRHGYRQFCGFVRDRWRYGVLLFCV